MKLLLFCVCLIFASSTAVSKPDRLGAALKAVLGHLRPQVSQQRTRSTKSSIRKRCADNLACEWPIPGMEADNVVLINGQIHVDAANDKIMDSIEKMNHFYAAKNSHLPSIQAQVSAGKIDWIAGPQIVVGETYSNYCKWNDPTSPANVANIKGVFIFPWEINNAFHTLNDNIMSVLSDVILDYLHAPGDIANVPYTLYQFKYTPQSGPSASAQFKEYQFDPTKRPKTDQPSLLYELLPLIFGAQNIKSASEIMQNGPHCIKHLSWSTAKKPIYKDTLVDLRRAVYDVLQHVLHSYLTESTNGPVFSLHTHNANPIVSTSSTILQSQIQKPSSTHKPRVIIVSRANSIEPARKLNKQNELLLAHRFTQQGFDAEVCCDFNVINTVEKLIEKFMHVDICIGVHGAGLANCVLAKSGMTMVELQTHHNYGSLLFQKIAHMASGHHVFHDIRVAEKMSADPLLRQGYVLSEEQMSDIIDLSKRMYLHTQRTHTAVYNQQQGIVSDIRQSCTELYTNSLLSTTSNSILSIHHQPHFTTNGCKTNIYTTPPPVSELVILDYKHNTIYLQPDMNSKEIGHYVQSILTTDFTIGNMTAWRKPSNTGPVKTKKKDTNRREIDEVLRRNQRTYWLQLNPSLRPYTKESILGPRENATTSECIALHYHQFRQLILRPTDKQYHSCDKDIILRKRTGRHDNLLLASFV